MRILATLGVLCAVLLSAAPVAAQVSGDGVKVAVIDVERILLESERGKAALGEIESLRQQKQQEGQAMQQEIQELRQQVTDGRLSLSEERLAELQKKLEDKVIALQRFQDDANRELTKTRDQVLKTVEDSVFPVINQVGEEGGYTLIFNKFSSGLIYADDAVDITAEVIERYNQGSGSPGGQETGGEGGGE
ncbi:MAG: OmpH family outer membrane protein [Acidobacteriota bacterium]